MFKIIPIHKGVCAPKGFYAGAAKAGFKKEDYDVGYLYSKELCDVAYLFTDNKFQAAPLKHALKHNIKKTNLLLVNSKNANAMTGEAGIKDVEELLSYASSKFENVTNPLMSSTGVIGLPLNKEKIKKAIDTFTLEKEDENFAHSIMTTDKYSKTVAFEVILENGESFRIGAAAKGAGMINPALATMLCFITTDAAIPEKEMKNSLQKAADQSFNAISVDGDRSTNDSVFLLTNSQASYDQKAFDEALRLTMQKLAFDIVKDGEGSNKLVAFNVINALNEQEAEKIAKVLSNSLLVKTAIFGEDPNWGRIASTIGASGCSCDETKLMISFGDVLIYDQGKINFDEAFEAKATKVMKQEEFMITCDIGMGKAKFTAYGCDLSYEYVKINGDYRT